MLAASRSSRNDSSSSVDRSTWPIWVVHAAAGIRLITTRVIVLLISEFKGHHCRHWWLHIWGFSADVLHPGLQHGACYLYLGHSFSLYNTFIFVYFLSFLHSTRRHMRPLWTGANGKHVLYWAHATGDKALWKSFPNNQLLQKKKRLSDSKPQRTFSIFYILRITKIVVC